MDFKSGKHTKCLNLWLRAQREHIYLMAVRTTLLYTQYLFILSSLCASMAADGKWGGSSISSDIATSTSDISSITTIIGGYC